MHYGVLQPLGNNTLIEVRLDTGASIKFACSSHTLGTPSWAIASTAATFRFRAGSLYTLDGW